MVAEVVVMLLVAIFCTCGHTSSKKFTLSIAAGGCVPALELFFQKNAKKYLPVLPTLIIVSKFFHVLLLLRGPVQDIQSSSGSHNV